MSSRSGPSTVSNGLVFSFDLKNDDKSWKGAPTTNLIYSLGDPSAEYSRGEFGQYFNLVAPFESNGFVPYSLSFEAKGNIPGNCLVYMQNGSYTKYSFVYQNITLDINWQYYKFQNITPSGPTAAWLANTPNDNRAMLATYTTYGSGRNPTLRNIQLEVGTFSTPFVNNSRSNTQTILDLTETNTITANSLTYTENSGFSFNGTSDYISLPNSLGYTTEFSQFAWFKSSGAPAGGYHIIFGGQEAELSIPTSGELRIGVFTSTRYVGNLSSGLTDGNWHYVGMTYKASEGVIRGYKDGIEVGTIATNSGSPTNSFVRTMGRFGTNTTYYTNGKILLAQIYNRALTAAEVKQNFDAIKSRYPGHSENNPAYTASQIKDADSTLTNGFYWISPAIHSGSPEYVFVDFDGSVSGITDPGPWIRIRYAQDYYTRAAPWTSSGNSATNPGAFSGDFSFEQNRSWINSMLSNATDVRQRFESWGYGSVGWTYSNGEYMGVKAFNGNAYNGANASNIVKQNKPSGISHGVTNINTFDNPTAQGTDPTDTNDSVWRVGVFYFRDISGNKILPISGIWNGDVDTASEQRYFPFRNGEAVSGVNSDIWIKLK